MGGHQLLLFCAWLTEKGREEEEVAGWPDLLRRVPYSGGCPSSLPVVAGRHGHRHCCATERGGGGRKENELGFWKCVSRRDFDPAMETDNRPMGMNGPDVLAAAGLNMAQAGAPNTGPGPG